MGRKLFGTDGIRGKANHGDMTPEVAFRIGAAVAVFAQNGANHTPRIVIGKDTRVSGYMFETALSSGICAMGGNVMLSGPLPTPGIAHITQSMRADAGIVVSASHNPYEDNGIKIFGPDGYKLDDAIEERLEELILGTELDKKRAQGTRIGSALRLDDAQGRYIAFVKASFPSNQTLDGVKVVVDAAHGAAYKVAPAVFRELGATVHSIGVKPNGRNINRRVGALHPEACAREVRKHGAQLGIALDGDADRLIVVDERGEIIDGDTVMALCARRMLANKSLRKKTLVATVMSNLGLEKAVEKAGGKLLRTAVGDRYVVEAMRKKSLNFGGEQSGHLIFRDHATTGDGLIAGMQLLGIMGEEKRPISELAQEAMTRVPQILLNFQASKRRPIHQLPKTKQVISSVEGKLRDKGRVLVRWSGTEPKLRVMVEGPKMTEIKQHAERIGRTAMTEIGA